MASFSVTSPIYIYMTPAMISLLSKGLNFCPTPGEPDRYKLRQDLDKFHVSLRRSVFFDKTPIAVPDQSTLLIESDTSSDDEGTPFNHYKFKNPSNWNPKGPFQLEAFIMVNESSLNDYKFPDTFRHNLIHAERQALAELKMAHNIIIKPADKGSAVVIQNLDDYIQEGIRQLSDPKFYRETRDDLTSLHNNLITDLIDYLQSTDQISDKCRNYLLNESPRTPQLYLLPKIHKNTKPVPGRPIVSANNSPTEKISQLADFFLQPLVQNTKSYIRDTTDFINKINTIPLLTEESLLCTIDVCSLYTNIPNQEGITACRNMLEKYHDPKVPLTSSSIVHLLEHVLYMNNFDFNGKHYLQVGGTAMGTKVAPSFANIFMAHFEDTLVYTYHTQPLIWLRYIDDIFMVWNNGRESLDNFLTHLNSCHETIKFTSDISPESVTFLDTTVKIDSDRRVYTDLYCKPTDSHNYLLFESSHPSHLKTSLPYSQLLRVRRICSKLSDFDRNAIMIGKHFLRRHYPANIVEEAIIKARRASREELLSPTTKTPNLNKNLFLISHYNPTCSPFRDLISNTWPILGRSVYTENLHRQKIIFGNRRTESIRDILVHAKLTPPPPDPQVIKHRQHSRRCIAKQKCRYCSKLDKTGQITCHATGKIYTAKHNITCNSNNLIYCISCKVCQKQYVGQTKNEIKERFKTHFYSIDHPSKVDTTIGRHFSSHLHNGISNVTIHVLDFIQAPNQTPSAQRLRDHQERFWIHRLSTIAPLGLNSAD